MPSVDKIKIDGVVYDITPNTLSQINANAYGLTYIGMMSEEQTNVPLFTISSHGAVVFTEDGKAAFQIKDLLWENPAPRSEYSGGTINLDLSNYSEIIIDSRAWLNPGGTTAYCEQIVSSGLVVPDSGSLVTHISSCMSVFVLRQVTLSQSSIIFANGFYTTGYNNWNSKSYNAAMMVPYRIWGWNPPHIAS